MLANESFYYHERVVPLKLRDTLPERRHAIGLIVAGRLRRRCDVALILDSGFHQFSEITNRYFQFSRDGFI